LHSFNSPEEISEVLLLLSVLFFRRFKNPLMIIKYCFFYPQVSVSSAFHLFGWFQFFNFFID
jgi:hypothetical protein